MASPDGEPVAGARIERRHSLRLRMLAAVAAATAIVVGGTNYLQKRTIEHAVEREALDAAGASALGVAASLTERDSLPSPSELEDLRVEFMQAVPALRALTITRIEGGSNVLDTSTERQPSPETLDLAQQATQGRELVASDELPGPVRLVAVPLERDHRPYGAVVVTMYMGAVKRVRHDLRLATLAFAPVAFLILTGLIDLLARRLVFTPLSAVRLTMSRATGGDLSARVPPQRADEIGAVARGLNAMLERVADFNAALRQAVDRATEQLTERNRQLAESAQRLFAARRELAKSEQLAVAGQMAASVAHQIGTPLNLISGYVQMILEDLPPGSSAAARLRTVQEQIGRVTTIVRGLLDQARRPVLSKRLVPAEELVSRACELARPVLEAAKIELHLSVEPNLPSLDVDAGQMEQVFLNLVTNSIDAMPQGGMLHVLARDGGGAVEFTVADTGLGISAEDIGRVFDPLFTTKRPGKGTGLGLTIVRDVVAAHGGSVNVTSEAGRGTTAVIRLPAAVPAPEPAHV